MRLWSRGSEGGWPWLAAGSVALSLLALLALLVLLGSRGLVHFWPAPVEVVTLDSGERFAGQRMRQERVAGDPQTDVLYRTGNRDLDGNYWRWVDADVIDTRQRPDNMLVLEREHWGEFLGRLVAIRQSDAATPLPLSGDEAWQVLSARLERVEALRDQHRQLSDEVIEPVARRLVALRSAGKADPAQQAALIERWETAHQRLAELDAALSRDTLILESVEGRRLEQPLAGVLAAWQPNAMTWMDKLFHWARGVGAFLSEGPRAGNLEGGVWPAIFGTVMMVLLMSLIVTPFGVLAAIYLNEVAHQGPLIRLVRIAVRNLAGVPSIVYGVFGLGVFVYGIGGQLDSWFFSDSLPSPTFGTGGLLWASLTLALLTLPVVIVATEEGLARIPVQQREGALALGATRYEMLRRVVLPMAVPAMLTGVILAVARAAGEVAPLMLVGVARLAPQLPLDGEFPFLHLDNKFMHLGYHVYNIGFQGGDVERALPLVYATALLLVVVIVVLNLTAISLRHHLRARHRALDR